MLPAISSLLWATPTKEAFQILDFDGVTRRSHCSWVMPSIACPSRFYDWTQIPPPLDLLPLHPSSSFHPLQEVTANTLFLPSWPQAKFYQNSSIWLFSCVNPEITDSWGPGLCQIISLPHHTTQSKHSVCFDSLFN